MVDAYNDYMNILELAGGTQDFKASSCTHWHNTV
jgi:hypothetical protein